MGYFGILRMHNTDIEISAKPENEYGRHPVETICWNGHIIKAQTLDLLYRVYCKNNRTGYIKKIEDHRADRGLLP